MRNSAAILQVLIPMVLIGAVLAFFPVGLVLIVMLALALVASIVARANRYADTTRWICTGVATGGILGLLLSIMNGGLS